MALKIDEIMDLSLDDYIAISKKNTNSNAVTNKSNNHEKITLHGNSNDEKFGRRKGNIDDEEDDDEDDVLMVPAKVDLDEATNIEEIDTGIWKGPDSTIAYMDCHDRQNDLRDKLNNSNNKNINEKISSVQYRMMAPNNSGNRPRGIPTLLPLDAEVNRNWVSNRYGSRRNRGNRGNRGYTNFQRGFNNASNNFNDGDNGVGGVINGRVQRNRKQDFDSKNFRFSIARNNATINNYNVNGTCSPHPAQNMIIETPSSYVNLIPSPPLNSSFKVPQRAAPERQNNSNGSQSFPIGNLTPKAEAALNLNSMTGMQNSNVTVGSGNESLKSLLGFQGNVSGEMMPVFASRLMDFIQSGLQNPSVHKPVYDMKIQKDIHEIQKKPLLYKCPGGEVVSSDGAGVNCKIIPRTSGVSLNCRFA